MPFLQFFTSLPAKSVPEDFIQKTALLLTKILKDKPLERISVHLMADQIIYNGSDPKSTEQTAYAVLRSIGCVTADDNRKTTDALTKHVKQELGINNTHFKMFFIDLDPNMCAFKGKIVTDNRL